MTRSVVAIRTAIALAMILAGVPSVAAAQRPDRLTPVVATVIAAPQPVRATDGRRHLAYELQLTNRSAATATVQRVDVLARGRVVGSLAGDALANVMVPFGGQPGATLDGGQGAFAMMHVSLRRTARLPRRLVHRLTVSLDPPDLTVATTYRTAPTGVARRAAVVVAPPLRGPGWVAANGCCAALTAHRGAVLPVNGALHVAERFAIDFVHADRRGLLFSGPRDAFSSYPYFGIDVRSATGGRVVGVVDDVPETTPGTFPAGITAAQAGGNHIVVAMGHGRYAFYAHLQPNSVRVRVGDRVRVGQRLARLGNSGNSDAPHLHFHVMDGPAPLASNGLPYRFTRQRVEGTVTNFDAFSAGQPAAVDRALRGAHRGALPLNLQMIDFG